MRTCYVILLCTLLLAFALPSRAAAPASAPSPLYQQLLHEYLTADWDTLAADLTKNTRDIAAFPKDQQADIAYIRQALADGRPAWWNTVKQGKKTQLTSKL